MHTLIIINFNDLALRFYYTIKTLFQNLYYYFQVVTNSEVNEPKQIFQVLLEHHNNNFVEVLPFDYEVFVSKLTSFFHLLINEEEQTRYVNNFNYIVKEGVVYATGIYDSDWIQTFTIMPDDILFWIENNIMLYPVDGIIYL